MFLNFIDRLGTFFDRRFILAYWLPSFIFVAALTGLLMVIYGVSATLKWWDNLSASAGLLTSLVFLFLTVVLALVLQPLTIPLIRLYLGYWPRWLSYFETKGKSREREAWRKFQVSTPRLRPTRLGNVLASNYEYAYRVYRIDPAIWLPRLTPLLPESFRAQMDGALTPLFCLLNLSSIFLALAVIGGVLIGILDYRWWLFLLVWVAGLVLAFICYQASISQSNEYGMLIRVAFDLYRSELIKQMRVSLPDTPQKEFALWSRLRKWIHFTDRPPRHPWRDPMNATLLPYDNYKDPSVGLAKTATVSVTAPVELRIQEPSD